MATTMRGRYVRARAMGNGVGEATGQGMTASRRALLKGAGAFAFTTALLATGELAPVAPYRVAAADSIPRPSGPWPAIATAADTLYQTFLATDFQPNTTANGKAADNGPFSSGPIVSATAGTQVFSARMDLPQGATIVEVLFFVIHNDANTMQVTVGKYGADGTVVSIGSASVTVNSAGGQIISVPITAANATVDNSQRSYVLEWLPSSAATTQEFFGARVGYTLPGKAQLYGHTLAGVGVSGVADNAGGVGVQGNAAAGFPVIGSVTGTGSATNTAAGVLGSGTKGPGVQGQSTNGHGLVGTTNDNAGHAGLIGNATTTGGIGLMGIAPNYGMPTVGHAGEFYGNVKI